MEKNSWFDSHRRFFLPNDNTFRRNKKAFKKDKVEMGGPPPMLTFKKVWNTVRNLPTVIDEPHMSKLPGYEE